MQVSTVDRAGNIRFQEIFMFSHQAADVSSRFTVILTENASVSASDGHYLYASKPSASAANFASATLVRASDLKPGHLLWSATDAEGTVASAKVVATTQKVLRGLYNPHTASGTIVVNGFAAATFTDTLRPDVRIHTLVTAPALLLFRLFQAAGAHKALGFVNTVLLALYFNAASVACVVCSLVGGVLMTSGIKA